MALSLNPYCLVVLFLFWISLNALVSDVGAAGECGRTPIRSAAASLSPCLGAARNARAKVPPACCAKVGALLRTSPRCLCAILLSPLAKQAGIMPGIAIAIPKKCNIRNRQAGKKCGINEGTTLKRLKPRARGRSYMIKRPTCHITIALKDLEFEPLDRYMLRPKPKNTGWLKKG
ncbi:hypothetical protein CXB51_001455 [Gossypium anomalum]|uniref:Bifunctional inhibitor/plant lipid transfer protein/seed storage helical domain-containing protein n=1 Tax=Gossypium anomalum TaxID=47600 RepID=A0A8J6D9K6_9ROSI|nr:hypothetical protein CXB51_001455 [Gossypium anomalum]